VRAVCERVTTPLLEEEDMLGVAGGMVAWAGLEAEGKGGGLWRRADGCWKREAGELAKARRRRRR
jgi:hypothetical protein